MTCDVKKVTYNMYTCYTCCMRREMMVIDGRNSAKCQKSKTWGHNWHFRICLSEKKTKRGTVVVFFKYQKRKRGEEGRKCIRFFFIFSERECDISLRFWAIRPSEFFGARRKDVLRGEGNAWAQVLGVFDNFCEIGVSPYLVFIIYLSTLLMFELNEVVRGRLIGPKS